VFPTRFRAFGHGMSAASGKAGAIISALVFNSLSKHIGTPAVLWIFMGCCIAGAGVYLSTYHSRVAVHTFIGIGFTLLLPEVKGRDPDLILAEEMKEERVAQNRSSSVESHVLSRPVVALLSCGFFGGST
jgi:MFS transporter, PHS family, inorganic phosphate transporter